MQVEFKPPKKGTASDKIAELLCKAGILDFSAIAEAMCAQGMKREVVTKTLTYMKTNMWVDCHEKKYELSTVLRRFYEMTEPVQPYVGEIVQPREIPKFRPIQPKNQFWKNPRYTPRDINFKSIGNPSPHYGTD
jgi:hypothetical protein